MGYKRFSPNVQAQALERQNMRCAECGETFGEDATSLDLAHHIQRDADGGDNDLDNCVMLCRSCHDFVHNGGKYREPIQLDRDGYKYLNG